ncbi:MAG: hypothetical protein ACOC31_06680 [Bacteroidota bacterium]
MKNNIVLLYLITGAFLTTHAQTITDQNVCLQAKADSRLHYSGQNSGAGWVTATTIVTTPLLGLIPAIAISSAEPSDHNLNYRNVEQMQNYEYASCYKEEAHKTKKRKVWRNYGIGAGVWLGIILLL